MGLRDEIAAAAAQLIADDGLSYEQAKRKAYEGLTGGRGHRIAREDLPSNAQVEDALREHLALYHADTQPQRLQHLRAAGHRLMVLLENFEPWIGGAVVNGTATEHSGLHLICRASSAKELGIFLINHGLDVDAVEWPGRPGRQGPDEALAFTWENEPVVIRVTDDVSALKHAGAIHRQSLEELL
jgi:hypothetical protein